MSFDILHFGRKFLSWIWKQIQSFPSWMWKRITEIKIAEIIISVCAIIIAYQQMQDSHIQTLLARTPSVNIVAETDVDDPPVGISLSNSGPGPATIKSLTYFVDNKPVADVAQAIDLGKLDGTRIQYFEVEPGDTLGIGESHMLLKYVKRKNEAPNGLEKFADYVEDHVGVELEFCSFINDECYKKCSQKNKCAP